MIDFLMHNSYLNIVFRCIVVYLFIVIAIRIFGKKELAQLSVVDLVFILLISNAVQNAMVGENVSLSGGIVAAVSLFVLNYFLKRIIYKNNKVSELLQGESILLIYKGILQSRNLEKAEITILELEAAIREHGVEEIKSVDLAMFEVDGNISVISDDFATRTSHTVTAGGPRKKHRLRGRVGQN